jgi:hypothetical protein
MLVFTPRGSYARPTSVARLGTVSRRWRRPVGRAAGSPLGIYGLCTGSGPGRYWPRVPRSEARLGYRIAIVSPSDLTNFKRSSRAQPPRVRDAPHRRPRAVEGRQARHVARHA